MCFLESQEPHGQLNPKIEGVSECMYYVCGGSGAWERDRSTSLPTPTFQRAQLQLPKLGPGENAAPSSVPVRVCTRGPKKPSSKGEIFTLFYPAPFKLICI